MWYEKAIHEFWISCPSGVPADLKQERKPVRRPGGFETRTQTRQASRRISNPPGRLAGFRLFRACGYLSDNRIFCKFQQKLLGASVGKCHRCLGILARAFKFQYFTNAETLMLYLASFSKRRRG